MPSVGGGVYQPTTVSYESRPFKNIRNPKSRTFLLILFLCGLLGGIVAISCGLPYYIAGTDEPNECPCVESPLLAILVGLLMLIIGFIALIILIKITDFRRDTICVCPFNAWDKKNTLSSNMKGQNGDGCNPGIISLNPCKDSFIPQPEYVSTGNKLPTLTTEDEELRNLMPKCKECVNGMEESDRMLEPDPRIVLRPMRHVEDM